ncbi:MAG: hypothetical protein ABW075_00115 [Aeromicrobium sp.]
MKPSPAPSTAGAIAATTSAEKMVEGKDFAVVGTLPAEIDGDKTYWFGTDAQGTAYGEITVPDPTADPGSMALDSFVQPVLLDTAGELTRMTPVRDSGTRTQMTGADADERWVTWLESASGQVGAGRWTLFSYERSTGALHELGSWKDEVAGKDSGLDYEGRPEILGDEVVMTAWSMSHGRGTGTILTAPLDGSAPLTELVADAKDPDVDAQGFSYVDGSGALMYRETATGASREVGPARAACQFYRTETLLTCTETPSGMEVRIAQPSGRLRLGPFSHASYPALRDGWATFVEDADGEPTIHAVDLARSTAYEVSSSQNDWRLMGHGHALVTQRGADDEPTAFQLIALR